MVSTPGHAASLGDRAVQCAAFNLGNWDYEVEYFDPVDRSDGWKQQADGFSAVALRDGQTQAEVSDYLQRHRGVMKKLIISFIFKEDAKTERTFEALSRQCDKIIRTEPEIAPFR